MFIIFNVLGSSLTYAQNLQVENDTYTVYLPLIIQYRPPEADDFEPDDDWDDALEPGTQFIKVVNGIGVEGYQRYIIPDYNISFTATPCP